MNKNAREVSVEVLGRVLNQGAYSNLALNHAFSSVQLEKEDVGLVTEITYGTLKYLITIDEILKTHMTVPLKKVEHKILNLLRISIYQLKYLDKVPSYAVINEAVELSKKFSKKASGFVNGVLRGYLRKKDIPLTFENHLDELSKTYSFPIWMISLFEKQYGERTVEILEGLNERPSITFRVNVQKMTRDEALNDLLEAGYDAVKTNISPYGIEITGGRNILHNELYQKGVLTVQDESSMLVAPLLKSQELSYMDLCAAPGGKATHLGELVGDNAKVFAYDLYDNKIKLIKENIDRLSLTNMNTKKHDAKLLQEDMVETSSVLLDAPCSGLGIIRKKPEIKYMKTAKELESLTVLQKELLETASRYVSTKGVLVYSTCTLNKEENEDNARWFLQNHPDFRVMPVDYGEHDHFIYSEEGFVTILPGKTMDGFFISCFVRK